MASFRTRAVAGLVALGVSAGSALAHGGGSGGGGASGAGGGASGSASGGGASGAAGASRHDQMSPGQPAPCGVGYVARDGACVRVSQGVMPDPDLYAAGRALALAGHYAEALPVLEAVRRSDDPMVYTMRGFAIRKLGDFDRAMVLYRRALALDPGNVNTHEYIGEGYVVRGELRLARIELAAVRQGCGGTGCEQFEDLQRAIETGVVE